MSLSSQSILTSVDIINALPGGIVGFEDGGTIRLMNQNLAGLLNYQQTELIGKGIATIFSLSTNIFYQTHIFPLLQLNGNIEEIFISLKSREGKSIPVLLYGKRISVDNTIINLWELLPVWQRKKYEEELLLAKKTAEKANDDNLELRRIKEELEIKAAQLDRQIVRLSQINQEYTAFSKVISHDLQEPIRKIHLFTDILKQSGNATEADDIQLAKIQDAVDRLASLTRCLDRYVSIDTLNEGLQVISLHQVIESARQKAIDATNFADFDFSMDPLPSIEGFPSLLEQMFFELLKNAIHYKDKDRRLTITIKGIIAQYNHFRVNESKYKYVDFVRLSITDNGTGFDDQYTEYVFEMFRRLDFQIPGLGFGLAFSRKIVDRHFGTITASAEKGKGSTFHVLLPLVIQGI